MEDKFDFTILQTARLRTVDVAKLINVSRVTVSMWMNGHAQPHSLLHDRVRKFLDAVKKAMQAGLLPVPVDARRRERGFYVQRVLGDFSDS